tara:strand:+ start:163 stop:1299 length:1137 start_codon:yes stop_codon:yes gene_type:complete
MSQCESIQSSRNDVIYESLNDLKSDEDLNKKIKQWVNDNDADDILLNFAERIGIEEKYFEESTQEASQHFTERIKRSATIDIDYTIINDLHRLKHISQDKKYNLQNIKVLIEQLKEDGLLYLAGLLEYIDTEYFNGEVKVSSGKKLVLFRKLLEATIPAMQHLHDTIKAKGTLSKETKLLYRVWRRPAQETYIFGKDSGLNKIITTDVFLSTSTDIEKVKRFYKTQCAGPIEEVPIIWEISMDKDPIHPDSRITKSDLDELVLNIGSRLQITGEKYTHKTYDGQSFTVKKFVYQGHVKEERAGEFYGKSSYYDAIEKFKKPPAKKRKRTGGKNTQRKKEIMGRTRCIYKKPNDRKEYVKYKGELVTLKEFKNNFKKKS